MADIKVYGTLVNATPSGKIAMAGQVYDEELGKFQGELNKEVRSPLPPKIRVASWNVGGFSLGTSGDPTITPSTLEAMSRKWHEALNGLGTDVLMCCEYNTEFMDAQGGHDAVNARDEIFSPDIFMYAAVGPKLSSNHYMQTAIFANTPLNNMQRVNYPNTTQTGRYYEVVDVVIAGKTVKVIATHFDWNQGSTDAQKEQSHQNRISQINKLINDFADYDYVIIGADCNVNNDDITDYDIFKEAGYRMLNHGYLGDMFTWPAGNSPTVPFDNVVYKGFTANKVGLLNDDTLSDHMAIYGELTMIL